MPNSLAAFLSYTHRDDSYYNGAITKLQEALSGAIGVAIGEDFSIFQDRKEIAWGEHWPSKLEQGIAGSRFLIAILSPSFFKSDYCRKELSEFLEIERATGRKDLILPIYFASTPLLEDPVKRKSDPLAKAIGQRQSRDWRELKHLPFDDYKVRRALDSMAEDLVKALERSESKPSDHDEQDRAFATPFAEQDDTYATGAFEDPAAFVSKARDKGLMEARADFERANPSTLPKPGAVFRDIREPWCPELVVIPKGSFVMGSPRGEEGHEDNEEPEHRVRFERPFCLGIYPVTFEQFDHFCIETGRRQSSDRGWGRGRRPIINVDVDDAEAYLTWLSNATGRSYGLPSEAMWEYACRAGTTTPFSTGANITTDQANYDGHRPYAGGDKGEEREQTTEVGAFPSNAFGLFDMHGNVWEWCADKWHESYDGAPENGGAWLDGGEAQKHVVRGGAWFNPASLLRSASRIGFYQSDSAIGIGFRCARLL